MYDIEKLISKYQGKDYITILSELTIEVAQLDSIYSASKSKDKSDLEIYRKYAGDFLFYLNTGVIPFGIGIEGLKHFQPIIESLVERGQLKEDVLKKFK